MYVYSHSHEHHILQLSLSPSRTKIQIYVFEATNKKAFDDRRWLLLQPRVRIKEFKEDSKENPKVYIDVNVVKIHKIAYQFYGMSSDFYTLNELVPL